MGAEYSNFNISGSVAPGYESVKQKFEENFRKGLEKSAQLCAYVDGELVVDLWGAMERPDKKWENYNGDSLTTVYSSTKSLTAIVVAIMVDRGLLKYDAKISEYWPEFAENGKEDITLADLMKHQAGLAAFDTTIQHEDTLVENIKKNKIGEVIEKQILRFPGEDVKKAAKAAGVPGVREYHAFSRGWIANEIVRRVHPENLTIGEILKLEISSPLQVDTYIGVDSEGLNKYVPGEEVKASWLFKQGFIPKWMGRGADNNIFEFLQLMREFQKFGKKDPEIPHIFEGLGAGFISPAFNKETVRKGESSSVNGNCSARGLAKTAAVLANGGTLGNVQLVSQSGWDALHANPTEDFLFADVAVTPISQGGVAVFPTLDRDTGKPNPRAGYVGWFGYGGSVFQWHPKLKIGFGYTPTLLMWNDMLNAKGARLQEEVAKCAEAMKK